MIAKALQTPATLQAVHASPEWIDQHELMLCLEEVWSNEHDTSVSMLRTHIQHTGQGTFLSV
jgi:hypothetical protein